MKNREQLWEDYEEARFALLMDALAEAEGEEALRLSEALNRDPEGALPPEVDRRCEAVIRGAFVQRRLHATGRTAVRWLTKVLVAATLVAFMFAAAFALSEDVRVATLNTVIKVMDDRTQITFESADGDNGGTAAPPAEGTAAEDGLEYHYNIALEWVPEGYKLEGGWSPESGYCDEVRYTNEIGLPLSVNITRYDAGLVYTFDTEDRAQKAVEVQGHQATLYSTNEGKLRSLYEGFDVEVWSDLTVFWKDDETQSLWLIDATNLTEEEMLRLAEGVHWRGAAPAEELEYHYNIALEWVPEGFELEGGIEGGSDLVSYLSPVDGLLEVSVTPYSQSSVYNLNTEGCTKQEITVQGHPAELYVTGEEMLQKRFSMTGFDIWSDMMIYWIDENNRVIVQIDATNLTEEEMLRLAEGFHWGGGQ